MRRLLFLLSLIFYSTSYNLAYSNSDPLSALEKFLEAQITGNSVEILKQIDTSDISQHEFNALKTRIEKLSSFTSLEEFEFLPVAVGISKQGNLAIVRFLASFDLKIRESIISPRQISGNIALLIKKDNSWSVHSIAVDDLLTTEFFNLKSLQEIRKTFSANKIKNLNSTRPTYSLIELTKVNEEINKAIYQWQIDESKVSKDIAFSAFGKIPIMGDAVSNGYTIYERLKTICVELPQDYRAGNLEATMLDIGLVAWGPVQFFAEFVPALDIASDIVEGNIEAYRYNAIQRFNYLQAKRQLLNANFKELQKFLLLRFTPKNIVAKNAKDLDGEVYSQWKNKSLALKKLQFLSDKFLRSDPVIYFDIGAELPIKRQDNEMLFNIAKSLGAIQDDQDVTTDSDDIVYLPLRLTYLAESSISQGNAILQNFNIAEKNNYPTYKLTATRGEQTISIKLNDGTSTNPLVIDNLVFNAIVGIKVTTKDQITQKIRLKQNVSEEISFVPQIKEELKNKIIPPTLNGLKELLTTIFHPTIVTLKQNSTWPDASLNLLATNSGATRLDLFFAEGINAKAIHESFEIEVINETPAKFVWVLKEIYRKGKNAEILPESKGDYLTPDAGDLSTTSSSTYKYYEYVNGRNIEKTYTTSTSGDWTIPAIIVPGTSFTINMNVSHDSEKYEHQATLISTLPSWDKEYTNQPFPTPILTKKIKAISGGRDQASITLYAPGNPTEGQQARFSFALYETRVSPNTYIPKYDLRASRTFTYVLVKQ